MLNYEIENGVLKRIYYDKQGEGNEGFTCYWGSYIAKIPDNVVEIGEDIFDESIKGILFGQPYCLIRGICIPFTVKKIANNAFNLPQITLYIEEENDALYKRFDNEKLGYRLSEEELGKEEIVVKKPKLEIFDPTQEEDKFVTDDCVREGKVRIIFKNGKPIAQKHSNGFYNVAQWADYEEFSGIEVTKDEAIDILAKGSIKLADDYSTQEENDIMKSKTVKEEEAQKPKNKFVWLIPALHVFFRLYEANGDLGSQDELQGLFYRFTFELDRARLSRQTIKTKMGCVNISISFDENCKITSIFFDNGWFHYTGIEENLKYPDNYSWYAGKGKIDYELIRRLTD